MTEPIGRQAIVYVEGAGGEVEKFIIRAAHSYVMRKDDEFDVTFTGIVQNGPDAGARSLSVPRRRLLRVVSEG
jgi:hypothetical protein